MSSLELEVFLANEGEKHIRLFCGNCGSALKTSPAAAERLVDKLSDALENFSDESLPMDENFSVRGWNFRLKAKEFGEESAKAVGVLKCEGCGNCPLEIRFTESK